LYSYAQKNRVFMNVSEAVSGCSTGQIAGLNQQVIDEILKMKPSLLSKINHPLIDCSGAQNNPYLQTNAYINLVRAVEYRDRALIINSCFRTAMQQWMLRRQYEMGVCGIMAAAPPPHSNHNSALAIDIEDAQGWRSALERFNWVWIGAFDPMHFDYSGGGENLGYFQTLAFQRLYNRFNPHERIAEDGAWGNRTANAIARSPVDGFGIPATLRQGNFSKEVGKLQEALRKALGLSQTQLSADCRYGSGTAKFVAQFQASHGMIADGIAGPETLKKLGLA
jgi:hypothetical protein